MALTVKQFKKEHPELKGNRIVLCEHLRNKSVDLVDINLFIGDNSRVLLCPICEKVMVGTALGHIDRTLYNLQLIFDMTKKTEYQEWLEKAGKDK